MTRRRAILISLILAACIAAAFFALRGRRYELTFTQQQIQDALDVRFPIDKSYFGVADLRYHKPRVDLKAGDDRIGIEIAATLKLSSKSKPLDGTIFVRTGLRYDPATTRFYLDNPKVEELKIQGIPIRFVEQINRILLKVASEHLDRIPIYDLSKRQGLQHIAAKAVLKDFKIEDGRLRVTLGL